MARRGDKAPGGGGRTVSCELAALKTSPEALRLTSLNSLARIPVFLGAPPPSRGLTYKLESRSHAISPSEGKGCVRHDADANVSAT